MMPRRRTVPPILTAPSHNGFEKQCTVMTETAIHTVALPEGHFASIVLTRPDSDEGAIAILDRDETEAHIQLLQNAIDDANRLDRGEATRHAAPSLRRS